MNRKHYEKIITGRRKTNKDKKKYTVDNALSDRTINIMHLRFIILVYGDPLGVMVIVAGIGHDDTSSNPGLIAFHIALIPLGKAWIQLFSLQLWVNSRADWFLQPW